MCDIPDVGTNLAADAFFHKCFLDMTCIFPLNLGTPHLSPLEPPGKQMYPNQSMQGQQGIIPDIATGQYVDCMSLLEVLSHQSKCKNVVN